MKDMVISELIILLERFQKKNGDVEVVFGHDYEENNPVWCVDFDNGVLHIMD